MFSDDDLKQLKEYAETPMDYPVVNIHQNKLESPHRPVRSGGESVGLYVGPGVRNY